MAQELPFSEETILIHEGNPPQDINLPKMSFQVGFSQISRETSGSAINKNMIAMGLIVKILGIKEEQLQQIMDADEELMLLNQNTAAIKMGEQIYTERSFPLLPLPRSQRFQHGP